MGSGTSRSRKHSAAVGTAVRHDNRVLVTFDVFNVFDVDNIRLSGATVTNYRAGTAPDDCGFGPPTNPNFLQVKDANGNYITTNISWRTQADPARTAIRVRDPILPSTWGGLRLNPRETASRD